MIGRNFTADEPGQKLVGDTTYLPALAGWWYLATVIEPATREVTGYAMADHHRTELVVDAPQMAGGRGNLKRAASCTPTADRNTQVVNSTGT
ncbi:MULTISPECIES: DDE-type integrase/transposase/recombinase [unclassified Streptomyces]|uniref:DDE-type integrase/transposase/recombinase n=1 Tax=unclassified Streptomyces TaxID=2593676 RepID=UPI0038641DF4